ncbi:FAD-dependent oxidoreductase [Mesorhizobium xinjiangense]|uniref:FAD-dependent oxidoreductase n=1 Tax=Mesorhizobium xinjiangense TaxID=2678685 RepID=UPI0012ED50B0|nr:FAD-dependent oxidoreductase [Mesorhizobium xinjiangense]
MIHGEEADLPAATDVCIIGAGPTGLALAFQCAGHGLSVTVLEAGGPEKAQASAGPGLIEAPGDHHADAGRIASRGVGGTSRLWGGRCVPFDDIDFEPRQHVPHSGWPLSHGDVSAYYGDALRFLGCGDPAAPPLPPHRRELDDIRASGLEFWSMVPDLGRLHGKALRSSRHISVHTRCSADAIALDADGDEVTEIAVTRPSGPLRVKARCFVLAGGGLENARLLMATQRRWPRKFAGLDGPLGRFYTGHLTGYLARIHINDPALAKSLWYTRSGRSAYERRRLSVTSGAQMRDGLLNAAFWMDSVSIADPAHGSGALSLAYLGLSALGLHARWGKGLAPSFAHVAPGRVRHWDNVRRDPMLLADGARVLGDFLRHRFGNRMYALVNPKSTYLLRYHAEQSPDPANRVRLDEEAADAARPRLRVDYRFAPNDIESVVASHALLDGWLRRNGLGRLDYLSPPEQRARQVFEQAVDGYHQIGLTRMSASPREGVVDAHCRVHDVKNLYVAGSSVFPTAGQANPTLPAVALAMRLGDQLARRLRGG